VVEGAERKGLKGTFRRPMKRFGKKASTKTVRKRRLVVGEAVERGIFRAPRIGKTSLVWLLSELGGLQAGSNSVEKATLFDF
jgi:hypothetical protein